MRIMQNGSVMTFTVIGVVLVLALATSVYVVNQRTSHVEDQAPIVTEDENEQSAPEAVVSSEENAGVVHETETARDDAAVTESLPETGVASTVGEVVAIASLTGSTASYMLSRRNLPRSL